ncbi:MAG: pilin [Candidatus Saccharimonadales bacterium]
MLKLLRTRSLLALGLLVFVFSVIAAGTPTVSAAFCDKYKDDIANIACESGYDLGQDECDAHYNKAGVEASSKEACNAGARAAENLSNNTSSNKKASEKLKNAKKVQKKAEQAEKKAKKAKDQADKKVKQECKKGGDAKKCAAARKAAAAAGKKHAAAKKAAASAKSTTRSIEAGICKPGKFLGLTPWYGYLGDEFSSTNPGVNQGDKCTLKCFNFLAQDKANDCGVTHSDIPYVLLAVVDSLLRVAGIVAVIFVIVGAIKYITSSGNPEQTASAQSTILNALVGLAIALVAVGFISFLSSRIV